MIFDELRVQDAILVYLYEHITDTPCLPNVITFLRESGEDVADEGVWRQVVILERKNLLMFASPHRDASLVITGEGCVKAEAVLVRGYRDAAQREDADREAAARAQCADMQRTMWPNVPMA